MFKIGKNSEVTKQLAQAFKNGNEEEIKNAWDLFSQDIQDSIKEEYESMINTFDTKILAQRGYRILTQKEKNWYQKLIDSAKSLNPKQAFAELIEKETMPETIIEDVYKDLQEEHPLLSKIQFHDVKYLTKWLLSNNTKDRAIWGEITSEITKKLEGSFKTLSIIQNKLSAYIILAKDMLDLGPVWLDAYVRKMLKEAISLGLEYGIICGKGVNGEPIGVTKKVSKGVSVDTENGYPTKAAIEVINFLPENYGALIADTIAKNEDGTVKNLKEVSLIVNPIDYLKKVMPATTILTPDGTYKRDLFPFPTNVIPSIMVDEGKAILADLPNYFLGIGHSKEAIIEYSDDYKFLEDQRVYKAKMYADGRPADNNVSAVLDISNLDPAYITVLTKNITDDVTQG